MNPIYLEFGGGLGDCINTALGTNANDILALLPPDRSAHCAFVSHNPYVTELFRYHPNAQRITSINYGYWQTQAEDVQRRNENGLPPAGRSAYRHIVSDCKTFWPSPEDLSLIPSKPFIAVSAGAGLIERTLPSQILEAVAKSKIQLVQVGRNYDRFGRTEPIIPGAYNLIDKLTVPGTLEVVRRSIGLITAHSALNIYGWHIRKPQLLLYPEEVQKRHFLKPDQWSFGAAYPETIHGLWSAESPNVGVDLVEKFLDYVTGLEPILIESIRAAWKPSFPPGGFTPMHDVSAFAAIARLARARYGGDMLEIGCNQGLMTRELSRICRHVFAIDYCNPERMDPSQRSEAPSEKAAGCAVQGINNVTFQVADSATYEIPKSVRFILVDGDHSEEGVRIDTQRAVAHLSSVGGGIIAWHDYYEGSPDWCAVKRFVDSTGLQVRQITNSHVAYAEI